MTTSRDGSLMAAEALALLDIWTLARRIERRQVSPVLRMPHAYGQATPEIRSRRAPHA